MKKTLLILTLLIVNTAISQNYKFGKVSKVELSETQNAEDPEANATVLYKSLKIHYDYSEDKGFYQVFEMHKRIKIYNKEGFDWATQHIKLYDRSSTNSEKLEKLNGYTFNIENNKVEKTKLKSGSIFEEKNDKNWATTKFTMPNIKVGSVIEFLYIIESPYISSIDDVALQFNIPIKKLEVDIRIPEYFVFNKIMNPRATYYPKYTETKKDRKFSFNTVETASKGVSRTNSGLNAHEYEFVENVTLVNIENVPALKDEPYVNNLDNYRAKLVWEYTAYKSPNGKIENFSTTWDKVTKTIYERASFGEQLEEQKYFKDDLAQLIQGVSDPMEQASLIFNFVKSKVKWNGYIGYGTDSGVKKAYKEGVGNTADINLMLVAMLKAAGINASPVLISTRANGIPIIPTTSGFNYVVAGIELPNGLIYLDATNPNTTANILPTRAINWQGRIVRERGSSSWVSLTPKKNSKEITAINVKINEDLSVTGKVRNVLSDYAAYSYREKFLGVTTEQRIIYLEAGKGDIEISNIEIKDEKELSKPVSYSYDYNLDNAIEDIGGKLYFPPLLFLTPKENPFKQENRAYPIDFIYSFTDRYTINLMLPEGYNVDTLPQNEKIQFNGSDGDFTYLVRENGRMMQITMILNINKSIILPEEFEQFKAFYQSVIEKKTEQIVLKKG